jgi:hypothetical protein
MPYSSRSAGGWLLMLLLGPFGAVSANGFQVAAPQYQSATLRAEVERLQRSGLLSGAVSALNAQLILPRPVSVRLIECGESNAYYDPEAVEIQMCLELMEDMASVLEGQFEDRAMEADALTGAWLGTLLHEVGHALVDVLDLPITGREEDVVDQLSAWMLISGGDADAVLGFAATYYTEQVEAEVADFAGVHALNEQRYYNLLCWAYGSDPESAAELTESWELPMQRAELCEQEFRQMDRAWSRLLAPHLRRPMAELVLSRPGAAGIMFSSPEAAPNEQLAAPALPAPVPLVGRRIDNSAAQQGHGRLEKIEKISSGVAIDRGDAEAQ